MDRVEGTHDKMLKLENELYVVEMDPDHGTIQRVTDKVGGFDLITEPRLAESFRLLVPLPDLHANYIVGRDQSLTSSRKTANGIALEWEGPLTSDNGAFDILVTMWVELIGEEIEFRIYVQNNTLHEVAEVWYPILGGMTGLGGDDQARRSTMALVPNGYAQWHQNLFRTFGKGYDLGTPVPEHLFTYPSRMSMPWMSLYQPELGRGAYFAAHDLEPRAKTLRLAMHPGIAHRREGGDWPMPDEVGGEPMGVVANWAFFPYTRPGGEFEGPPIVLRFHEGDWRQAGALYRGWFTHHFPIVDSQDAWVRQETAYLDTMFLLPEDNVNVTFSQIPEWAQSAADNGLRAVLISGWHCGGHDRGYPQYEPDPRLGTWEDLEAGISKCHEMGLRVFFFVNIQPVDTTTEAYRKEWHRYLVKDPAGCSYGLYGWGMGTLGARAGFTRTALTQVDPAFPEVRDALVQQMKKLAEVGADGVHIDKLLMHALDFNPDLEGSPDKVVWEGTLRCVEEMLAACREVRPDFCISYEGWWDRLMAYSDVVWWAPDCDSVIKTVFPQWVPCVGVTQPYDYNVVNWAVLRGHNLLVGPASYTAGMDYPPMRGLAKYIGEVTRIRRELLNFVSRGELLDPAELQVDEGFRTDGQGHWNVFRDTESGRRAAVIANLGRAPKTASGIAFDGNADGPVIIHQPFEGVRKARMPVMLEIPGERVAFLLEEAL